MKESASYYKISKLLWVRYKQQWQARVILKLNKEVIFPYECQTLNSNLQMNFFQSNEQRFLANA